MGKPVKISGVVITFNEEKNLDRCLQSLKNVADELVVVDSFSTDGTESIARQYDATFLQHPFEGHIEQKNYALGQASHSIILSLDADEALSPALEQAIMAVKANWGSHQAFAFNRLNRYGHRWIRHGVWYPDRKVRLFDRHHAQWAGENPHDKVVVKDGKVGHLKGDLLHYTYDPTNLLTVYESHYKQINFFTSEWAKGAYTRRKKVIPIWHLVLRPPLQFLHEYVFRLGFLDGPEGFHIAKTSALHKYLKYRKLQALYQQDRLTDKFTR